MQETSLLVAKINDSCGTASSLSIPKCATENEMLETAVAFAGTDGYGCCHQQDELLEMAVKFAGTGDCVCWDRQNQMFEPWLPKATTGEKIATTDESKKTTIKKELLQPAKSKAGTSNAGSYCR